MQKLSGKAFIFWGGICHGWLLPIGFLQSEPILSQNLLVDPCLVQVTDHCISMPSVVYCVVYSQMCLIDIPCYLDHIFKGSCWLVVPPNVFLWWNWTNNLGNRKFPSIASDICWTYANEFNTDLSDWMLPAPLLLLGSGPSFCTVLAMCAHLFRCPYTLCVQISNISMWNNSMKIMLYVVSTGIPGIVLWISI